MLGLWLGVGVARRVHVGHDQRDARPLAPRVLELERALQLNLVVHIHVWVGYGMTGCGLMGCGLMGYDLVGCSKEESGLARSGLMRCCLVDVAQ